MIRLRPSRRSLEPSKKSSPEYAEMCRKLNRLQAEKSRARMDKGPDVVHGVPDMGLSMVPLTSGVPDMGCSRHGDQTEHAGARSRPGAVHGDPDMELVMELSLVTARADDIARKFRDLEKRHTQEHVEKEQALARSKARAVKAEHQVQALKQKLDAYCGKPDWSQMQMAKLQCDDQGAWGSCSFFALGGAVQKKLESAYGLIFESANYVTLVLLSRCFTNSEGKDLVETGVCVGDLVGHVNRAMDRPKEPMQFITAPPNRSKVCCQIKFACYCHAQFEEFRQHPGLRCAVVVAQNVRTGRQHAMHCVKAIPQGVVCQNSWGESESHPCIPGKINGDEYRFVEGYIVSLTAVQEKKHGGAKWLTIYPNCPEVGVCAALEDGGA